jgi:hypothetical protein
VLAGQNQAHDAMKRFKSEQSMEHLLNHDAIYRQNFIQGLGNPLNMQIALPPPSNELALNYLR